ncbi:TPA: hypothetical protein HA251_03580 [Candidatus Woesearchaeota archaeon]|nr:hypothetical protein [Candidatus Woesearchaeota archaeon]
MQFEESGEAKRIGTIVGYCTSYAIATIALYTIMLLLRKLPQGWTILHAAAIIAAIAGAGALLRRLLR